MQRMDLDQIRHNLRFCGMTAYRAIILAQAAQINELQEQVEDLQEQVSTAIMARLLPPKSPELLPRQREVIEDLGHGWQIERSQPEPNPAATATSPGPESIGTPGVSWLPGDPWSQYCDAVENR
jgi:hypothetical protein